MGSCDSCDTSLDHGRAGFLDPRYIACYENALDRSFAIFITDRNLSATLWIVFHLAARHFQQLRHRRKSDCQADRIHIEMLFGSRNELEVVIHFCNRNTDHILLALCFYDGMGKIKRNTCSCNLCCMNSVPTDTGCCINQCNHITAALHQLEGYDQTDISGTKHQNFVSRFYPVQIHHRLCGSCADDSRKIPALKGNHIFCGSCSNDYGISFVVMNLLFDPYHNFFIQIHADNGCIQHNFHTGIRCFLQQLLPDHKTSDFCLMFL